MIKYILLIALIFTPSLCLNQAKTPHIIHFMVDDLGFFNVNMSGTRNKEIYTPNFDQFVNQSVFLDRFYTYKFCSPTRVSLMSGRLPIHIKEDNDYVGGIPPEMTILPKKLKQAGYKTHQIGKWHGGAVAKYLLPASRGFDTSYGYLLDCEDHWNQTVNGGTDFWVAESPEDQQNGFGINGTDYNSFLFMKRFESLMAKHNTEDPLYIYYAENNNHAPLEAPEEYLEFYPKDNMPYYQVDRQHYQAMTTLWDSVLGNITDILKAKGMWEHTLLIFTSDNGGAIYNTTFSFGKGGANNYPLKGGKITNYEGGVRTLAAVGGGLIPDSVRGTSVEGYVHICDFYSTICHLAGVDPEDHVEGMPDIDSLDMWDMISGQNLTSPRTVVPLATQIPLIESISPLKFNSSALNKLKTSGSIIVGDYKLIQGIELFNMHTSEIYPNSTYVMGQGIESVYLELCTKGCLYNIKEDPEERNNLNVTHPEKLEELFVAYQQMNATKWDYRSVQPENWNNVTMKNQMIKAGNWWSPAFD